MLYYNLSPEKTLKELNTTENGLTEEEASRRREIFGLNDITTEKKVSAFKVLLSQFSSPLVWILVAAVIIAFSLNELTEAVVILIILLLNAFFGFVQEFKAEKAIEALKKMTALKAKALRNSQLVEIDTKELVPGDIICLETGDRVPADARIISCSNLEAQEAALTGESTPVAKTAGAISGDVALADMNNMVFSSTIITVGRCRAVVTHTGKESEIGRIAKMIETAEETKTPLQVKLHHLAKWLGLSVVAIALIVFAAGVIRDGLNYTNALNMLIVAIALAVAAIPEGLPAIVTISLAISVKKMVKKNALVRKLASVETLGACSVICTDKTGTLTHNEMTVTRIFANNETTEVSGSGYSTAGGFTTNPERIRLLLTVGMLCNNSEIISEGAQNKVMGDPTEGALIVSAMKAGFNLNRIKEAYPRTDEIPFSSERKMMTTIHRGASRQAAFTKGAPDVILEKCTRILINGKEEKLTTAKKEEVLKKTAEFASSALRVLGFAYNFEKPGRKECEKNMVFVGIQGMIDPPRAEAKQAIEKCRRAGIKVVMITGDHKDTAVAVARALGITGYVLTGKELEKVKNLEKAVETIGVYARVDPKHKLKIVEAFQKKGHIIAMTGDGVNDAPALKEADIGVAMGITGTDVAKEASDMILSDDNFASIVSAVEEGRTIFDNIKKFARYLLSSNAGEVLTIFGAMMAGLKLPVTAIQILWINLVTDGLPALAVGVEKPEQHIMERPPRSEKEEIITKKDSVFIIALGMIMMAVTVGMFISGLLQKGWVWGAVPEPGAYTYATTIAFCTLMMLQMFNVINNVSEKNSIFKTRIFNNKYLLLSVALSIAMQIAVVNIPWLANLFEVTALSAKEWIYITIASSSALIAGEAFKLVKK